MIALHALRALRALRPLAALLAPPITLAARTAAPTSFKTSTKNHSMQRFLSAFTVLIERLAANWAAWNVAGASGGLRAAPARIRDREAAIRQRA